VITIREATPEDTAALIRIGESFTAGIEPYRSLFGVMPLERVRALVDVMQQFAEDRAVILVAADGATVYGVLVLVAVTNLYNGELWADEFVWWVDPAYVGHGAGPRLLAAGETWALARGIVWIKMIAPQGSRVGRFYGRHGYVPVETAYLKRLG
jgi:GNAT superfamily N-acetyltransferase